MAILKKQNKSLVIRKVRIKMTCSCHPVCPCTCTTLDGFVAPHGELDAKICGDVYWRINDTPIN